MKILKNIKDLVGNFNYNSKKKTFLNKFTPTENRYVAYEYFAKLLDKNIESKNDVKTYEIVELFCDRLGIQVNNSIKDSEEKSYLLKTLVKKGDNLIPFIEKYIESHHDIALTVELLFNLQSEENVMNFLANTLSTEDSLFDDNLVEKRIEIMKQFIGKPIPLVVEKGIHYMDDSDDRLVLASINLFGDIEFDNSELEEKVREILLNKIVDHETSVRIRIEMLEALTKQNWKVSGFKKEIENVLPEGYYINSKGQVRVIANSKQKL